MWFSIQIFPYICTNFPYALLCFAMLNWRLAGRVLGALGNALLDPHCRYFPNLTFYVWVRLYSWNQQFDFVILVLLLLSEDDCDLYWRQRRSKKVLFWCLPSLLFNYCVSGVCSTTVIVWCSTTFQILWVGYLLYLRRNPVNLKYEFISYLIHHLTLEVKCADQYH